MPTSTPGPADTEAPPLPRRLGMAESGPPTTASRRAICCHCSARCGVLVEIDEHEQPLAIQGDPSHPVSKGFICPRGRAAVEYFHRPERLDHPLKRVGRRGEGRWEQIPWAQAIDEIAARFLQIRDQDGPEAFAYLCGTFHGADGNVAYRLMHHFGSPNSGGIGPICGGPRLVAESLTFGWGPTAPDIAPGTTRTVLLWAQHPSASAPALWGKIRAATRAGARLIVVDPRPTLESRLADLWLRPRPGTDAALALGLVHVILAENLWDRHFAETWTVGLDELAARVREYPPERVAAITQVSADDIRRAARLYAGADDGDGDGDGPLPSGTAAVISNGAPNGLGRNALSFELALAALIALTGNLDRPGGARLLGPDPRLGSKTSFEEYGSLPEPQRRLRLGADRYRLNDQGFELLSAAARRVWPAPAPDSTPAPESAPAPESGDSRPALPYPFSVQFWAAAHPPSIFRAILSGRPYPVRALLVQHNNPLGSYPNGELVRQALETPRLELSVVHELFMTPTAHLADYVLPAASWMEKPFLWSTGRGDQVMTGHQVTPPRHERRSDYDLCRDLGRALGQAWPDSVEDVWDEWLRGAGVSFPELAARDRFWLPGPDTRRRHEHPDPATGAPLGFGTPSGKVELRSSILAELGYDPLPAHDQGPDEAHHRNSDHQARYPLRLMTGATRIDATHQDHRQVPSLRARHPDPIVEIDPKTAARHDLSPGDWVTILTPRGSIRQRARLLPGLGTDRVNAERWWYPERADLLAGFRESNVSIVVDDDPDACDPAYGAWPFRDAWCRLEKE